MLSELEETNFYLIYVSSLAGDSLVYGYHQIYPETAVTIRYVAIVKKKVVILFSLN